MSICINCPETHAVQALYKYHQLEPMCEKHYLHVIEGLEAIFGYPITCHSHLLSDQKNDTSNRDMRKTWDD